MDDSASILLVQPTDSRLLTFLLLEMRCFYHAVAATREIFNFSLLLGFSFRSRSAVVFGNTERRQLASWRAGRPLCHAQRSAQRLALRVDCERGRRVVSWPDESVGGLLTSLLALLPGIGLVDTMRRLRRLS
jgi:hypothetical protein